DRQLRVIHPGLTLTLWDILPGSEVESFTRSGCPVNVSLRAVVGQDAISAEHSAAHGGVGVDEGLAVLMSGHPPLLGVRGDLISGTDHQLLLARELLEEAQSGLRRVLREVAERDDLAVVNDGR